MNGCICCYLGKSPFVLTVSSEQQPKLGYNMSEKVLLLSVDTPCIYVCMYSTNIKKA